MCWWGGAKVLTLEEGWQNIEQESQGGTLWAWTVIGGIRVTPWFLTYIFSKNMNDVERQRYLSRLKETQGTWDLSAIHDPRLDHGLKGKHTKVKYCILNLFPHILFVKKNYKHLCIIISLCYSLMFFNLYPFREFVNTWKAHHVFLLFRYFLILLVSFFIYLLI